MNRRTTSLAIALKSAPLFPPRARIGGLGGVLRSIPNEGRASRHHLCLPTPEPFRAHLLQLCCFWHAQVMITTAALAVGAFAGVLALDDSKWGWITVFSVGTMFLMSSAPCITKEKYPPLHTPPLKTNLMMRMEACLHTVPLSARATALGLMNLSIHAFGDVPSPIALGYLKACLISHR